MKLIIGLGNPGAEYDGTRHNVGFAVIDKIAREKNLTPKKSAKLMSEIFEFKKGKEKIILAKPQTFMNESGKAVRALLDFYKISTTQLIVVHDDKDFLIGEACSQTNRGDAGHNGVKSIMEHVGTKDFTRIRVGTAPVEKKITNTSDFVLEKFTKEEKKIINLKIKEVAKTLI
jgi:PTH1 family peptidyl-tRNA hydrolase